MDTPRPLKQFTITIPAKGIPKGLDCPLILMPVYARLTFSLYCAIMLIIIYLTICIMLFVWYNIEQ